MTYAESAIEREVGHPFEKWSALISDISTKGLTRFDQVQAGVLDVFWCLDQYRIAGEAPRAMGKPEQSTAARLAGAYRMKGRWFSDIIRALLENSTGHTLSRAQEIHGYSQAHHVDISWPSASEAPAVCLDTKVMGGPAYDGHKERAATADWTNRRKEIKFQATDLKLRTRHLALSENSWDDWRKQANPSMYFIWCARITQPYDNLERMVAEVRNLTASYLDGAAIFPYTVSPKGDSYKIATPITASPELDPSRLLDTIANRMRSE